MSAASSQPLNTPLWKPPAFVHGKKASEVFYDYQILAPASDGSQTAWGHGLIITVQPDGATQIVHRNTHRPAPFFRKMTMHYRWLNVMLGEVQVDLFGDRFYLTRKPTKADGGLQEVLDHAIPAREMVRRKFSLDGTHLYVHRGKIILTRRDLT